MKARRAAKLHLKEKAPVLLKPLASNGQKTVKAKTENSLTPRGGGAGMLQTKVTEAISRAALVEVAKRGFGLASMEAIAKRARVGKAALYRRWPSRDAMIKWLLSVSGLEYATAADTGSLAGDLLSYLQSAVGTLKNPAVAPILPHLYAEMSTNSHVGAVIRGILQPAKRERTDEILDRAIARKELSPQIHRELAADLMAGPLYWRVIVLGNPVDHAHIEHLARAVFAALLELDRAGGERAKPVSAARTVGNRRP
jgi:AcrR family transcriptional regulator